MNHCALYSIIALLSIFVGGCTKRPYAIARVQVIDSSLSQEQVVAKMKDNAGPLISIVPINGTKLFTIKVTAGNTSDAISTIDSAILNLKTAFRKGSQEGLMIVDPPSASLQ